MAIGDKPLDNLQTGKIILYFRIQKTGVILGDNGTEYYFRLKDEKRELMGRDRVSRRWVGQLVVFDVQPPVNGGRNPRAKPWGVVQAGFTGVKLPTPTPTK